MSDFIKELIESKESCEVDPLKLNPISSSALEKNRALLMKWVEKAWYKMYERWGIFHFHNQGDIQLGEAAL